MKRIVLDGVAIFFAVALIHFPNFTGLNTTTTDHFIHYRWASQFADSLAAGILSPSWEATSRGGLGDPVFVYYPPLFYYIVAAFDLVFRDIWLSIRVLLVLSSLATGAGVLAMARALGTSDTQARCVAFLATAAPMLLGISGLINAYPWFVATNLLIITAFALARVLDHGRAGDHILLAVLVGVIGLSHALSVLMFTFVVFLAVLAEWFSTGLADTRRWLGLGATLALGLALSASSLIPAVALTPLVTPAAWLNTPGASWTNTFALPLFTDPYRSAISYIVPLFQIAFLAALLVLALRGGRVSQAGRLMLVISTGCLILASELSYPLWDASVVLRFVQRPFRFLATAAAVMPVALAIILAQRAGAEGRLQQLVLTSLVAASLLTVALMQYRTVQIATEPSDERIETTVALRSELYFTPEHLIRGAGPGWQEFLANGGWQAACDRAGLRCTARAETPEHFVWTVEAPAPQSMSFPLIAYPAWRIALNGNPVPLDLDPATGLVQVDVPEGTSVVDAQWVPLAEQRIGAAISLAAAFALFLFWIGAFWIGARRRPKVSASAFRRGP